MQTLRYHYRHYIIYFHIVSFYIPPSIQCSVTAYAYAEDEEEEGRHSQQQQQQQQSEPAGSVELGLSSGRRADVAAAATAATANYVKDGEEGGGDGGGGFATVIETYSFDVTVRYVRREIRDLSDRDREIFFNAISVLQRVPSAVGRQVYGDNYYSRDYFNRLHFYGGERERGKERERE